MIENERTENNNWKKKNLKKRKNGIWAATPCERIVDDVDDKM